MLDIRREKTLKNFPQRKRKFVKYKRTHCRKIILRYSSIFRDQLVLTREPCLKGGGLTLVKDIAPNKKHLFKKRSHKIKVELVSNRFELEMRSTISYKCLAEEKKNNNRKYAQ